MTQTSHYRHTRTPVFFIFIVFRIFVILLQMASTGSATMTHRSATLSRRRNRTDYYNHLWKGLTNNAIAPAVAVRTRTSSQLNTRGHPNQKHSGGANRSNVPFVHDWMQPMSAIVEARRNNGARRRSLRHRQSVLRWK